MPHLLKSNGKLNSFFEILTLSPDRQGKVRCLLCSLLHIVYGMRNAVDICSLCIYVVMSCTSVTDLLRTSLV